MAEMPRASARARPQRRRAGAHRRGSRGRVDRDGADPRADPRARRPRLLRVQARDVAAAHRAANGSPSASNGSATTRATWRRATHEIDALWRDWLIGVSGFFRDSGGLPGAARVRASGASRRGAKTARRCASGSPGARREKRPTRSPSSCSRRWSSSASTSRSRCSRRTSTPPRSRPPARDAIRRASRRTSARERLDRFFVEEDALLPRQEGAARPRRVRRPGRAARSAVHPRGSGLLPEPPDLRAFRARSRACSGLPLQPESGRTAAARRIRERQPAPRSSSRRSTGAGRSSGATTPPRPGRRCAGRHRTHRRVPQTGDRARSLADGAQARSGGAAAQVLWPSASVRRPWSSMQRGQIQQIHGRVGAYLELPPGRANLNVVEMAREGLRAPLASALREARSRMPRSCRANGRVKSNGDWLALQPDRGAPRRAAPRAPAAPRLVRAGRLAARARASASSEPPRAAAGPTRSAAGGGAPAQRGRICRAASTSSRRRTRSWPPRTRRRSRRTRSSRARTRSSRPPRRRRNRSTRSSTP